jgi:hypothetical protein
MDSSRVREFRSKRAWFSYFRIFFWQLLHRRREPSMRLDPRTAPDSILKDIGLPTPSRAWDETTAFWR